VAGEAVKGVETAFSNLTRQEVRSDKVKVKT
jgi:hypothetical protein